MKKCILTLIAISLLAVPLFQAEAAAPPRFREITHHEMAGDYKVVWEKRESTVRFVKGRVVNLSRGDYPLNEGRCSLVSLRDVGTFILVSNAPSIQGDGAEACRWEGVLKRSAGGSFICHVTRFEIGGKRREAPKMVTFIPLSP